VGRSFAYGLAPSDNPKSDISIDLYQLHFLIQVKIPGATMPQLCNIESGQQKTQAGIRQ
jgi:hypothetical protein